MVELCAFPAMKPQIHIKMARDGDIMSEIKPVIVLDFDDFEDRYDRNGLNFLFYWKSKFPNFKVNIFAIPGRCSKSMLDLVNKHNDFISLLVHGWRHDDNFEVLKWDE